MGHAVYIVFSATPTEMGRLIRVATRNQYNHVSFSFEPDIHNMYSFARYYHAIPLYGGFVLESILRYRSYSQPVQVKICRLSVEDSSFFSLQTFLDRLWDERETYLYNTPAAVASLLHRQPTIPKTYTCATFVHELLLLCRVEGAETERCPTVHQLEQLLAPYVMYEGSALPLTIHGQWGEDVFPLSTTTRYAVYTTARHFGLLAKRVLLGVA
ncbi:MAG: hypothetical protein VB071_03620 [Lawsonibacter sp.]|nr:hypothetical protein [Lawsonibacter sp.]